MRILSGGVSRVYTTRKRQEILMNISAATGRELPSLRRHLSFYAATGKAARSRSASSWRTNGMTCWPKNSTSS